MPHEYTDQDTERVRQAERSAAGQETQQLRMPDAISVAPDVGAGRRGRSGLALLLIGLGLLLGAHQLGLVDLPNPLGRIEIDSDELQGALFFFTIASAFLFFSFWKRVYGLLIPGCIIAGFAAGVALSGFADGAGFFLGLGAGFLAIMILGRQLMGVNSDWAIFPAVGLLGFSMVIAASVGGLFWLPFVIIGLGLYLGMRRSV